MHPELFDLSGRTALVSGASRGIGESIAVLLAAQGARVVCTSRKLDGCGAVAERIRAAGGQAEARAMHVGDPAAIEATFAELDALGWTPDILVNNAAANPYFGPMLDMDLGTYEKTVEVNLRGYFWCSVQAGRRMKARFERDGTRSAIVNIASVNARRPAFGQGVYSMTKAGIVNLTEGFAKELAPHGVRVNAVLPAEVMTPMYREYVSTFPDPERKIAEITRRIPLGQRMTTPQEIADTVVFLLSARASHTTGEWLFVDGGYTHLDRSIGT